MIFIEPVSVYQNRLASAPVRLTENHAAKTPPLSNTSEDYWVGILLETLRLNGETPMRIPSLVSSAAKFGDYGNNLARSNRKLELFRLIASLIKQGQLRRIARNFVALNSGPEK